MPYITSVERIGMKIGMKKGHRNGEAAMLMRQLQRRFGPIPEWVNEKMATADLTSLEEWSLRFVDAQSLNEVFLDKV
ncbi:MAG: DUF4351 domain-containing protein [Magnetococcales bacterium]|nr:DUF4351 domain-containing protein [Magnetococcales bacterium]MBF0148820.1 DUF4351 domain-containing protein [Magnetococcales bacterium]MBF0346454.1 DUF4351 domain-containing protein [Magnetococcales bacterium]